MLYVTFDVFTQTPFAGNPLALVHLPSDGTQLSQSVKQRIAKEFNYAETVFLHPENQTGNRVVDIFTRFAETTFAGHPVIGTAHYLRQYIADTTHSAPERSLQFTIKAGVVKVEFDDAGLAIAEVPHNLRTHDASVSIDAILAQHPELVNLKSFLPKHCPVVSSVKGMTNILIDVSSAKDALNLLRPAKPPMRVILDSDYSPSSIGTHFYNKMESLDPTVEKYGVRRFMVDGIEDAATGSAASALAGFLSLHHGKSKNRHRFEMVQGVEMGRKSDIFVDVLLSDDGDKVSKIFLSGQAVKIMEGRLIV